MAATAEESIPTGAGVETRRLPPGPPADECRSRILKALKHPMVQFLREKMAEAGCPFWPQLFLAAECPDRGVSGYYTIGDGIEVCCNNVASQDQLNLLLTHELIHAYDDCRAKNVDWNNCAHCACTEIRASHLSGECHLKRELLRGLLRGSLKIRGQEPECVKRQVLGSFTGNPDCPPAVAKAATEAVWDICYNDTSPFERAP